MTDLERKVAEVLPCETELGDACIRGDHYFDDFDTGRHTCPAYYRPVVIALIAEREKEIEQVRAQALADRAFQTENTRLTQRLAAKDAALGEAIEALEAIVRLDDRELTLTETIWQMRGLATAAIVRARAAKEEG